MALLFGGFCSRQAGGKDGGDEGGGGGCCADDAKGESGGGGFFCICSGALCVCGGALCFCYGLGCFFQLVFGFCDGFAGWGAPCGGAPACYQHDEQGDAEVKAEVSVLLLVFGCLGGGVVVWVCFCVHAGWMRVGGAAFGNC